MRIERANELIDVDFQELDPYEKVPVTILSGFLGAGKTTVLENMLRNSEGIRVGLVVNDVADVNIDANLIRRTSGARITPYTTVELQNGCACCTRSDELFDSIRQLLDLGISQGEPFQHIVIELSGVAEPAAVKRNLLRAQVVPGPHREVAIAIDLKAVVTVVDASSFMETWMSQNVLGSSSSLWDAEQDSNACIQARPLAEFLAEQVEAADRVILNKIDLVDERTQSTALQILFGVMNSARFYRGKKISIADEKGMKIDADISNICTSRFGEVPLEFLLAAGLTGRSGRDGDVDGFRCELSYSERSDESKGGQVRAEETSAARDFGIKTMVYEARRPFSRSRFMTLLKSWPNLSLDCEVEEFLKDIVLDSNAVRNSLQSLQQAPPPTSGACLLNVVRSKGFCWVEDKPNLCYYWSHAGRHCAITSIGQWWADQSPAELELSMSQNPENIQGLLKREWRGGIAPVHS